MWPDLGIELETFKFHSQGTVMYIILHIDEPRCPADSQICRRLCAQLIKLDITLLCTKAIYPNVHVARSRFIPDMEKKNRSI